MQTILIFDWFGQEDLGIYFIEDAPEWLEKCHGQFINSTEGEVGKLIDRVCDAICENPENYVNPQDPIAGTWVSKKVDPTAGKRIKGEFRIVVTGFVP